MVLEIPGLFSLFPSSATDGDGYGANTEQRRKNEGTLGPSRLTLMHNKQGLQSGAVLAYLDTHEFIDGDFLPNEELYICVQLTDNSPALTGSAASIRIDMGVYAFTFPLVIGDDENAYNEAILYQNRYNSKNIAGHIRKVRTTPDPPTETFGVGAGTGAVDNWITKPFNLSLIGNAGEVGGNLHWRWNVYRRGELNDGS